MEANLQTHTKDLEKKLKERDSDKEQLETALCFQIQELKSTLMENNVDRKVMEVRHRHETRELHEKLKETKRLKKEMEYIFHGNRKCIWKQDKRVARQHKEFQDKVRIFSECEDILHQRCVQLKVALDDQVRRGIQCKCR